MPRREREIQLQVLLVDLDVQVPVVLHHEAQGIMHHLHLGHQLVNGRLIQQLRRLRPAPGNGPLFSAFSKTKTLSVRCGPIDYHAPHRVTFEDGISWRAVPL